jgi:2-amino-4-hydroxy-6-hydroxymethyldihydropteridine diphosphokinase
VILLGLGANLPSEQYGPPRETLLAALAALEAEGVRIAARSRWYDSAAWPDPSQPRYWNAVVAIEAGLDPVALLALLHRVEESFGRVRGARNAPRTVDLDLLDYNGVVRNGPEGPILPHPRLAERGFVLLPLREIAPDWHHPVTGASVDALIAALPADEDVRPRTLPPGA